MNSKVHVNSVYNLYFINFFRACIVDGRRIVDMQYVFDTISKIKHEPFGCTFSDLNLIKETQSGFYSQFVFKCKMCDKEEIVCTECPKKTLSINLAIVVSSINTGQGFSCLEQFAATLNMPCLSNPTYQKLHEEVAKQVENISWEATEEAAKEEAKLAYDNGDVSKDGIPMISVVADGAWCKRSYRSNYNALSGVVSLILL